MSPMGLKIVMKIFDNNIFVDQKELLFKKITNL